MVLQEVIVWFLAGLGGLTLLAIVICALAVYAYSRLVITFRSVSVAPDFKATPTSILGSIWNAIRGNLVSAAGGFVNGVRLDGEIICRNRSLFPLYLPDIDHEVSIGGKACENIVHTQAAWLKPLTDETIPIHFTLATGEVPHVAISGLTGLGAIDIKITSRLAFGHFSYLKITDTKAKIPDYLPKRAKKPQADKRPTK